MTPSELPTPSTVSNPHDAYVKSAFRRLPQARGFFRSYLPGEVRSLFDWRTLRLETESFLSDELLRDFADLRFTIRLVGDPVARRIKLLFEHRDQEAEVRQALHTLQDEFRPVKENIMTLLEHLEKRGEKRGQHVGKVATVVRLLSAAFPEFTPAVADQAGRMPDLMLDELTDAVATRRTWAEIEPLIRRTDG